MIFVAKKEITKVLIWMIDNQNLVLRARLHQTPELTLRQFCHDASDIILIENNGVASEWGSNPFSSDSIVFNEDRITSVITQ